MPLTFHVAIFMAADDTENAAREVDEVDEVDGVRRIHQVDQVHIVHQVHFVHTHTKLSFLYTLPMPLSLQDQYAPANACFGCGPANDKGLRIKSFPSAEGEEIVAEWYASEHHQAFPGMLNGGITGALLDCHSNWTAAYHLMKQQGADKPPCTVTADFHVKLKRPTPMDGPISLRARVVESEGDRAVVEATLEAGGKITATCRGTFVAVKEGHPAYHRW
jgi:acyl-coenzyme A thioesterase PaaI-like protein